MEDKIRLGLKNLIHNGKRDFVIYPFGRYGKLTKQILNNEFNIQELFIVDNKQSLSDKNIMNTAYLKERYAVESFDILVSVDPIVWDTTISIYKELVSFAELERISDILSFSPYFTPWNHFSKINYVNRPRIALIECIAREIYKNNIAGNVVEAGVFQGETSRFINYLFPDRLFYLFDTFNGFNKEDQENDDKNNLFNLKIDYSNTSEEIVLNKMHFPQNCIIKKGWFPQSAKDVNDVFSFVRLDMDLYDPIYSGLEFFYPKMSPGGYIVVHDCRSQNFDGARKAVIDFCKEKHIGYMCMPDNLGSAVINIGM